MTEFKMKMILKTYFNEKKCNCFSGRLNYFPLLEELINSIKRFKESENIAIYLDAGLSQDQKKTFKK